MSKSTKTGQRATTTRSAKAEETLDLVRELATILNRRNLAELEVELPETTIKLKSGPGAAARAALAAASSQAVHTAPASAPAPEPAPAAEPEAAASSEDETNGKYEIVKSPFVGTFYRAPAPDADPFVEVGARVEKGQVLCIVEAMKLMNEIEAEHGGVVAAVLADNAQPVEYGQALFKISAG